MKRKIHQTNGVRPQDWPARLLGLALLALGLVGCGRPMPIQREWVLNEVSTHYREFFPLSAGEQQNPQHEVGLLQPRFGIPVVVRRGTDFTIEILERGGPQQLQAALISPQASEQSAEQCLAGAEIAGCQQLKLELTQREPTAAGISVASYRASPLGLTSQAMGGFDLLVRSGAGPVSRAPKSVWLRDEDPDGLSELRVAHLSDLHVGKGGRKAPLLLSHVQEMVAEINRHAPDLVVVTGDLVHRGQNPTLAPVAQSLLLQLNAPTLVVLGNHDIEWQPIGAAIKKYGAGWINFARSFHPFLHFRVQLGGYDFVGFDSGPGERTARILTRGLSPQNVATLKEDLVNARTQGRRGVVLFSHAPSRAATFTSIRPLGAGFFGRMRQGRAAFEQLLVDAADQGQRVLHLAGHTHWSDVFEVHAQGSSRHFTRWPTEALTPCQKPLSSEVAIITTQAASHGGLFTKRNARGYGFAMLTMGTQKPEVAFHQYGVKRAPYCQQ